MNMESDAKASPRTPSYAQSVIPYIPRHQPVIVMCDAFAFFELKKVYDYLPSIRRIRKQKARRVITTQRGSVPIGLSFTNCFIEF